MLNRLRVHGKIVNQAFLKTVLGSTFGDPNFSSHYSEQEKVMYYKKDAESVLDFKFYETDESIFKIVKINRTRNYYTSAWCLAFYKDKKTWVGAYIGGHEDLFNKLYHLCLEGKKPFSQNKIPFPTTIDRRDVFALYTDDSLLRDIYNNKIKNDKWNSYEDFLFVVRNIIMVVRNRSLYKIHIPIGVKLIRSNQSIILIFNTGYETNTGEPLVLKVTMNKHNNTLLTERFFSVSKIETVSHTYNPLPVFKLFKHKTQAYPKIDGVEFGDCKEVNKLVNYKFRLECDIEGYSDEDLISIIQETVEENRHMDDSECKVYPYYTINTGRMAYILPLVDKKNSDKVIGALLLKKCKDSDIWNPISLISKKIARVNSLMVGVNTNIWREGRASYENIPS